MFGVWLILVVVVENESSLPIKVLELGNDGINLRGKKINIKMNNKKRGWESMSKPGYYQTVELQHRKGTHLY